MQTVDTSKILTLCLGLAGMYILIVCIMLVIHGTAIPHWLTDEIPYIVSFDYKLRYEGRWVIYLLFPYLTNIDPNLAWVASIASTAGGLFVIWNRITNDHIAAGLLAASCVFFPGFIYQNDWPLSTLPGSTLFLVSCLLCCTYGWRWVPVCTVVLFGCIQWFAFLLPLAVIPKEGIHSIKGGMKLLIPGLAWAVGLLLGFLVCGMTNLVAFGEFGVKIAASRNPNMVTGFDGLAENLLRYSTELTEFFSRYLGLEATIAIGLWVFLAVAIWVYGNGLSTTAARLKMLEKAIYMGYAVVVMLSPYLAVVPLGIKIGPKTLTPIIVGLVAILVGGIHRSHIRARGGALLVFALMGVSMGYESLERTRWGKLLAQAQVQSILQAHPKMTRTYEMVVVDSRHISAYFRNLRSYLPQQKPREGRSLSDYHLAAAFSDVFGVSRQAVLFCPPHSHQISPDRCSRYSKIEDMQCDDEGGDMCVLSTEGDQLIIRLLP